MIFWLVLAPFLLLFSFVLIFGAPYLPTLKAQRLQALELLDLKPGQLFYDLGCGDGRLLKLATKQGLCCVGYELNPLLAAYAWITTRRYRGRVKIICGSFWRADVGDANGIFIFLIDHHMKHFARFMNSQDFNQPVKLVSHAFKIPGKKPTKKSGALFLYQY